MDLSMRGKFWNALYANAERRHVSEILQNSQNSATLYPNVNAFPSSSVPCLPQRVVPSYYNQQNINRIGERSPTLSAYPGYSFSQRNPSEVPVIDTYSFAERNIREVFNQQKFEDQISLYNKDIRQQLDVRESSKEGTSSYDRNTGESQSFFPFRLDSGRPDLHSTMDHARISQACDDKEIREDFLQEDIETKTDHAQMVGKIRENLFEDVEEVRKELYHGLEIARIRADKSPGEDESDSAYQRLDGSRIRTDRLFEKDARQNLFQGIEAAKFRYDESSTVEDFRQNEFLELELMKDRTNEFNQIGGLKLDPFQKVEAVGIGTSEIEEIRKNPFQKGEFSESIADGPAEIEKFRDNIFKKNENTKTILEESSNAKNINESERESKDGCVKVTGQFEMEATRENSCHAMKQSTTFKSSSHGTAVIETPEILLEIKNSMQESQNNDFTMMSSNIQTELKEIKSVESSFVEKRLSLQVTESENESPIPMNSYLSETDLQNKNMNTQLSVLKTGNDGQSSEFKGDKDGQFLEMEEAKNDLKLEKNNCSDQPNEIIAKMDISSEISKDSQVLKMDNTNDYQLSELENARKLQSFHERESKNNEQVNLTTENNSQIEKIKDISYNFDGAKEGHSVDMLSSKIDGTCSAEVNDELESCFSSSDEENESDNKQWYDCSICSKIFFDKKLYKKHMRRCHPVKTNECCFCNKGFKQKESLDNHMAAVHMNEKPHLYDTCGYKSAYPAALKRNLEGHSAEKSYICNICGKSFTNSWNFKSHLYIHNDQKPYGCDLCGRKFRTSLALRYHNRIHTNERPYNCDVCGKNFTQPSSLKTHQKIHSGEKLHNCDFCGENFAHKFNLKSHMRTHTKEKPFNCDMCNKSFSQKGSLKTHMKIHENGGKSHLCNLCGDTFALKNTLNIHMLRHTGEKPHKCPICEKRFTQSSTLKTHLRTRHLPKVIQVDDAKVMGPQNINANVEESKSECNNKTHKCEQCGKMFSLKNTLKIHLMRHNGEKPHKCTLCPKSFTQSSTLAIHMRTHTGEKPYKCNTCEEVFMYKLRLKKHCRKHGHDGGIDKPGTSNKRKSQEIINKELLYIEKIDREIQSDIIRISDKGEAKDVCIEKESSLGNNYENRRESSVADNYENRRENLIADNYENKRENSIGNNYENRRENSIGNNYENRRENSIGNNYENRRENSVANNYENRRENSVAENYESMKTNILDIEQIKQEITRVLGNEKGVPNQEQCSISNQMGREKQGDSFMYGQVHDVRYDAMRNHEMIASQNNHNKTHDIMYDPAIYNDPRYHNEGHAANLNQFDMLTAFQTNVTTPINK